MPGGALLLLLSERFIPEGRTSKCVVASVCPQTHRVGLPSALGHRVGSLRAGWVLWRGWSLSEFLEALKMR